MARAGRRRKVRVTLVKAAEPVKAGDHGPDTPLARQNAILEPVPDDANNRFRLRRAEAYMLAAFDTRQLQALCAIRNAYQRSEMRGAGGIRERVDTSPRPDLSTAIQADVMTGLVYALRGIREGRHRHVIELVCRDNRAVTRLPERYGDGAKVLGEAANMAAKHFDKHGWPRDA